MTEELLWRLVFITVPLWAPFYFAWLAWNSSRSGEDFPWYVVFWCVVAAPLVFVVGIPLHMGWFLVNTVTAFNWRR